jgi:hypothetical protein
MTAGTMSSPFCRIGTAAARWARALRNFLEAEMFLRQDALAPQPWQRRCRIG